MTEAKFTPGPWVVKWRKDNSSIISMGSLTFGPHKQMNMPFEKYWGNDEADACLIAAAPDLYKELENLLDACDQLGVSGGNIDIARAVLAKARGENA